nr:hypothetical protein [Tanacetum cinerariifolium]
MVYHLVNGVRASHVEMICEMGFVRYVIQEIHAFMILIRILSIALPILTILHTPHTRLTRVIHMEMILILVMIVSLSSHLITSQNQATMKTIILIHVIHRVFHNNILVVKIARKIKKEQVANARYWKIPACCDDDDDGSAITPNEPVDSLSMGDKHLNTISAMKSNEFIKSCVKNLVPNPSESKGKNGCDVLACFTTFSNVLFDTDYEFDSVDDQSLHNEDVLEKIFSNPLFEEIISKKIDPHHFDAESDLIESMLNHDSSIISSSLKIDSLLDEFAGELTLLKSILPGIDKNDCHPENEIRIIERLLYDNSSPRTPEEFISENYDVDIESFSPSPIPDEDSDSRMEETNLSFNPDDLVPPSIEDDNNESERDVLILEELPSNYSLSLPEIESFCFNIPSFSRPPAKPPDGNTGILNIKMMGDISDQKVPIPKLTIIRLSSIPGNLKTLANGFYPSSLHFLSFNWESIVQYSWKFEDSCQWILSFKSSFPQLQLGIQYPNLID